MGDIEIPIWDSTKFLGVHIDNKLRWTIHVNNLHKKLMANKFLLSMSTNILNTNSLHLIYNMRIHSHLTHELLAWGPMASKKAIKDLTSIQDSCVHLVSKVGKNTNVMPLYNKQQLIWLPDLIKLELAKYGHGQTIKDYPASLQQIANTNGGTKKHHYPTRSKNTPNIQAHTMHQFNISYLCKGIVVCSELPTEIKKMCYIIWIYKELKMERY